MGEVPKPRKPPKRYEIPPGTKPSRCRSCQAVIYWVKVGGTTHPLEMSTDGKGTSHFLTCPQASQWSKGSKPPARPDRKTCEHDVDSCPRCGGEHGSMTFYELDRPADAFGWWALCPKTSEPLLLRARPNEQRKTG